MGIGEPKQSDAEKPEEAPEPTFFFIFTFCFFPVQTTPRPDLKGQLKHIPGFPLGKPGDARLGFTWLVNQSLWS